jgi:hypothetical protein
MSIEAHQDLQAFFHERLGAALTRRGMSVDPHTEFYLVQLLNRAGNPLAIQSLDRSFVERLAAAAELESSQERIRHFREMGDDALYLCGFFSEHLRGRGISPGYVRTMGGSAYIEASGLSRWTAEAHFTQTFADLAHRFNAFATVLDDVREDTSLRTPHDIIRLYDRWRSTRSPVLAERLKSQGVFPQIIGEDDETLH